MTLAAEDITQNQFIKLGNVPSVSFYVLHHAAPFHISLPHHAAPYHAAPFHISKPHLAAVRSIDIHAPFCSLSCCSLPYIYTSPCCCKIYRYPCTMLLILILLPNTPPMLSSCCFLPFFPSPYHSPDPYQEEKETPMESPMPTIPHQAAP